MFTWLGESVYRTGSPTNSHLAIHLVPRQIVTFFSSFNRCEQFNNQNANRSSSLCLKHVVDMTRNQKHMQVGLTLEVVYSVNVAFYNRGSWTANDQSLKVKDITWQDLRSSVFTFLSVRACALCVCVSVCLSALCMPQFWSHTLVDPYLGTSYVQLDAIKRMFWKKNYI